MIITYIKYPPFRYCRHLLVYLHVFIQNKDTYLDGIYSKVFFGIKIQFLKSTYVMTYFSILVVLQLFINLVKTIPNQ